MQATELGTRSTGTGEPSGSLHHIYSFGTPQDRQAPTLATWGDCQIRKGFVSDKNT